MSRPDTSRRLSAGLALSLAGLLAANCDSPDVDDPLLHPDLWEFETGRVIEMVPGVPFLDLGPDEDLGTSDDVIEGLIVGDVDLVIRAGALSSGASFVPAWLPQSAPTTTVGPFGSGDAVPFSVGASTTAQLPDLGIPTLSPSFEGVPVVAAAFGDLDGDGYVGITNLDGDPLDAALEQAELIPIGRSVVIASGGVASGSIRVGAAGPPGARLSVLLAAAAWVGPLSPGYFGGVIPDGPLVMTQVPFLPRSNPDLVLSGPVPIVPGDGVRVEIEEQFDPDPFHPTLGESFTVPVDGSAPTNDLAIAHSGPLSRIGLARLPSPAGFRPAPQRPLRPGLDETGDRILLEILQRLVVPDDGLASTETLRLVPLDALGNVTELGSPRVVEVRTAGVLQIVSPDLDGDPQTESFLIGDVAGVTFVVDDGGAAFDDPNAGTLVVDSGSALQSIPVFLPDPDVNDSGAVTAADVSIVSSAENVRLGDPQFHPDLDLDGSGRIDEADVGQVQQHLGESIPQP